MPIIRQVPDMEKFNRDTALSYQLRLEDFGLVMQDVYDFFFDVNTHLLGKGIKRLDEMLRPAAMSGLISDMVAASMAQHSRVLVENRYHNGHPDFIVIRGLPERRGEGRRGGRGDQEHAEAGRCGGHARGAGAVDVRVRLPGGQRDGARGRPRADEIHRSVSRPRDGGGFPAESAERTGHTDRYPRQARHREASPEPGVSGHLTAPSAGSAAAAGST